MTDLGATLGANVKTIRSSFGYPHWEVKKALTNAEGDMFKAIEALKRECS